MHRFFTDIPLTPTLTLSVGDMWHQITHVFRARVGESIILFGPGTPDFRYEITHITGRDITLRELESTPNTHISRCHLTLFQAYPNKIATIELLLQKITELGVAEIVFFAADRSESPILSAHKHERFAKIMEEALEQCGGNTLPTCSYLPDAVASLHAHYSSLSHRVAHCESRSPFALPPASESVGLWIGPEGGWSPSEIEYFRSHNMPFWQYNPRILRLETAAIVGAGMLLGM